MIEKDKQFISNSPAIGNPHPDAYMALLCAIPISLLMLALLEIFQMPMRLYGDLPGHLLRIPVLALASSYGLLSWSVLYQLALAAVFFITDKRVKINRPVSLLLFALTAPTVLMSYLELTDYPPFAGYAPFIALYLGLAALLFGWSLTFLSRSRTRRRLWWRLGVAGSASLGAAFITLYVLNSILFRDAYPTLHLSALQVSQLLLHASLSSVLFLAWKRIIWPRPVYFALFLGVLSAVYILPQAVSSRFFQKAEGVFLRHGLHGQSVAYLSTEKKKVTKRHTIKKDRQAASRFAKHSHLPSLPPSFDLSKYNILLISMEATRYDAVQAGRQPMSNTPNLHSFSQGRFWFTRAYTAAPYTMQVFASIFSMTYPSAAALELGAKSWNGQLRKGQTTVAERLAKAGWNTFWVSHNYRGVFSGLVNGLDQGFKKKTKFYIKKDTPDIDERVAEAAINGIDKHRQSKKPFFGWLFFESPHYPYLMHYPDRPSKTERQLYEQEVHYMDEQIGRVLNHLEKTGLLDKTIVIIHGDHGEELNKEHGGMQHNNIYIEVCHVPLIIHLPGIKGGRMDGLTSLTYLFPWLLQRGTPPLRKAALERIQKEIGPMMRDSDNGVAVEKVGKKGARSSLIWEKHHLIYDHDANYFELYDLQKDPKETKNLCVTDTKLCLTLREKYQRYSDDRNAWTQWKLAPPKKKPPKKKPRKRKKRAIPSKL
ncbi:MAG: sulfatase-like hydrolase/transferase [Deltaproteobacteria bacterium]|nr:sulfatase-like hydrolase/transferase [Deltaproteobacteria bacterium]